MLSVASGNSGFPRRGKKQQHYLRKEQQMTRYINPENIRLTAVGSVDDSGDILVSVRDVKRAIAQTPSEDVVEVVRCKNCIYRVPLDHERYNYQNKKAMYCFCYNRLTREEGYCNEGIRKEQT